MVSTIVHPQKDFIMDCLKDEEVKTVVVFGDTGMGKTWLASDISESVISDCESLFYGPLWVYDLNPQDEIWSVRFEESIAHQLSVLSTIEEWEEDDDDDASKEQDKKEEQQKPESLKEKISKKLEQMRSEAADKKKHLLLILDGIPDNEDAFMKELKAFLHLNDRSLFKVLITQRKEPVEDIFQHMDPSTLSQLREERKKKEEEEEERKKKEERAYGKKKEEVKPLSKPDSSTVLPRKEERADGKKKEEVKPLSEPDTSTVLQRKEERTDGNKKEEVKPLSEPDSSTVLQQKEEGTDGKKKEEVKPLSEPDSSTVLQQKDEGTDGKKKEEVKPLSERDSSTLSQQKNEKTDGKMKVKIEIKPLSDSEPKYSLTLLQGKVTKKVRDLERFKERSQEIAKRAEGFPAAIVVIAGALNSIAKHDSRVWTLEGAVEEAANCAKVTDDINPLLRLGYDILSSCSDMAFINCFSHSRQFFLKHGSINYNELIAYWILEGYFGSADHIDKAYEEGHRILMELVDCGILKIQEDDGVNMQGWALTFPDCRRDGCEGTSSLGTASVFDYGNLPGLGRIAPGIGMIKTLCNRKNLHKVSTLLIDGSRLCREVPESFLQPMKELQNLAIFNPRFKVWPCSTQDKLHLLVLRGCDQLQEIDDTQMPESLQVLEISGASSLEVIPYVFKKEHKLRSLNLSAVSIKSLPSSFSNLTELRWLILRDCSCLEKLPKVKEFTNLEVLDLSGATSLSTFEDKSFASLHELKVLDLSYTKINRLPFLRKLEQLTRLYLKGCKCLTRLPSLEFLSALQFLDLSDATELQEIQDKSFQNKNALKILNLSKTGIKHLPSNISNLCNLELLDLSDASNLVEIQDNVFEKMTCLRTLNLSNTKIKRLPSLSNLGNLRQLLLQGCGQLVECKHLNALEKLELLDLSDCSALTVIGDESIQPSDKPLRKIEAKFLQQMVHLQFLNLSGTKLQLPPISEFTNLTNLRELSLGGCSFSESDLELDLKNYTKLEVLDLSKTNIGSLQSLNNLSNLCELKLRDCSSLTQLQDLNSLIHLEVLDLWGTGIKEFTELSKLTRLKQVDLPDMKGIQKLEWEMIKHLNLPDMAPYCAQCVKFKQDEIEPFIVLDKGKLGAIYWHRVDKKLREIYFKTRSIPEKHDEYLEIIGYDDHDSFPDAVKEAILGAKNISLVDNKTINSLSKLSAGKTAKLKGCWLERCSAMESFFGGEESQETQVAEDLEILWASNLPNLKSVHSGKTVEVAKCFFSRLTQLYLDCCPMLKVVFPSSQLAENLEILEIKFCDKLEVIYASVDSTLEKLHTLHLMELPELTSIGVPDLKTKFPSLKTIKVRECPLLEKFGEIQESDGSVSVINSKTRELEY